MVLIVVITAIFGFQFYIEFAFPKVSNSLNLKVEIISQKIERGN